ncbi:MAG: efflux RND transporter periplasmic adaptor subunit [Thermoguttaceae bacterium]|nr:efflux RND transporter periplasmic adaptor subunit [Thermoguttaceae bacterium]
MDTPNPVNETQRSKKKKVNWVKILTMTVLVLILVLVLFRFVGASLFKKSDSGLLKFVTPTYAHFRHEISVRGDISSSENKDIKCQVRSTGGVMITWVIDEGTMVKEGQEIATLDSSALIDNRDAQMNTVAQNEAEVKAAENNLKTAEIALEEYKNGTYKVNLQKLVSAQIKAKEERDRLAEYLQHSRLLYEKGFVTKSQLDADVFSLKQAELDLRAAELDIYVLKEYTQGKQLKNYESDIETATANLRAKQRVHQQNLTKLKDTEEQIEFCTVRSPADGKVLYVNETNRFGTSEFLVCQGAMVRERQVFLRLPNSSKLQVTADIHEGKISYVKRGQPVEVRTDATGEKVIRGRVIKVNENPQPTNHWMGNVKEYRVTIELENPEGILPGMTADTKILVEETTDKKIMIPTHTVFEHGGKYYAIKKNAAGELEAIELELGHSNDKMVIVTSTNVDENTQLVSAAFENREKVKLPELPAGMTSSPEIRPERSAAHPEEGTDAAPGMNAGGKRPSGMPEGMGGPNGQRPRMRPDGMPRGERPAGMSGGMPGEISGGMPEGMPEGMGGPNGQRPRMRPDGMPRGERPSGMPMGENAPAGGNLPAGTN